MTLIVTPKNKKEETVLKAFLNSLKIGFYSEKEEDNALLQAMKAGRKTAILKEADKAAFLQRLKKAR